MNGRPNNLTRHYEHNHAATPAIILWNAVSNEICDSVLSPAQESAAMKGGL